MKPTLKLPFWMSGQRATDLMNACCRWWELVHEWLKFPFKQYDVLSAHLTIVDLLAYQRGIDRFDNEPEDIYRLRVKFALANAKDAGTAVGMKRIFSRLGIQGVAIDERITGYDWDMLRLTVPPDGMAKILHLLGVLLNQYGRTCRRWIFSTEGVPAASVHVLTTTVIYDRIRVLPDGSN